MKIHTELETLIETFEAMPGNYIIFQAHGLELSFLYYTKGVPALSEFSDEEYAQIKNPYDMILAEDQTAIQKKLEAFFQAGENQQELEILFRILHKSRGFIWAHMTIKKKKLGERQLLIANLLDVNKENEIAYAIMETSDRCICIIEKATKRFLYANSAFYDLIDMTPAEAMGKHCYELLCKTMAMKDNDNCLCYSSINADPPIETYNPEKKKYLTLTGKEVVWGEYNAYVFYLSDITEKKLQKELLEDSRKRFNVALDNSDLMIWEYDMVNHRCINSEKAGKDYNIPLVIENYPESLFLTGYTPPETVAQIQEVQRRLESGETGFSVERRTIDKFGKSNWQKVEYTLECDETGKPVRAIVCGLDITAQKELEQKYEEQMEYRNKLAKNAMFSVRLDLDADRVEDFTCGDFRLEKIADLAGSAGAFLELFFASSVFEPDSEVTREQLQSQALRETYELGRSQYQTVYRCSLLNLYLELNLSIYKNPGSRHLEVFFVVTDVTENMLMHRVFQRVVGKDYEFVAVVNAASGKTHFLVQSETAVMPEYLEHYDDMVMGFARAHKNAYLTEEDYHAVSDGMLLSAVIQKLDRMPVYEFSCKTRAASGEIHTYRLSFGYVDDTRTQIIFSRANITKVVEEEQKNQRMLEDALRAARQADRAKTEFLSRMSHDMRTPMNGIMGMTRLTQDIPGLSGEVQENLAAIEDSGTYLLQLINDTLDMSKIESERFALKPEVVDATGLIRHVLSAIEPLVNQKQLKLEFIPINAMAECIMADRTRMQQLLMNILSNAVKFTEPGGTIRMEVECLSSENGVEHDRISVEDNGCGMSEEFLQHIYEPFSQEQTRIVAGQEGTGLGMSIVRSLVELMGGRIEISSRLGEGTRVNVFLDFLLADAAALLEVQSRHRESAVSLEGKRVLLAEDHPLNATIAKRLLEKKKVLVDHAENGRLAVELFERSEPDFYDAVLMDIRMPELDGLSAARRIRALDRADAKAVPIIAMTANAYVEDVQAALDAGMNAHLAKPIDAELMFETLGTYMQEA